MQKFADKIKKLNSAPFGVKEERPGLRHPQHTNILRQIKS